MAGEYMSYWAVIPAHVLHNQSLSASAKLLYGEIAVRCGEMGYCYASNGALAADLRCGERTVTRLLGELESSGAIIVRMSGSTGRKGNRERRIYTAETAVGSLAKIGETASFGETGLDKNGETVNRIEYINPDIPPIVPHDHDQSDVTMPRWKPERFAAFWEYYRRNVRPDARSRAVKAWDKLKPSDELIARIGRALQKQVGSKMWQDGIGQPYASTYLNGRRWEDAPDGADRPRGRPPERQEEAFGEWH